VITFGFVRMSWRDFADAVSLKMCVVTNWSLLNSACFCRIEARIVWRV